MIHTSACELIYHLYITCISDTYDAGAFEDLPEGSSDAGWLGLTFTQVEDEEEWMGFLDWDAVAASAGQSSS